MTDNINWRDMPAGRELDRVIAERLGYTNLRVSGHSGLLWGRRHANADDHPYNVDMGYVNEPIPEYSTDTDAAFKLPLHSRLHWYIDNEHNCWTVYIGVNYDPDCASDDGKEQADTPALAICRAWLAWMDAKEVKDVN